MKHLILALLCTCLYVSIAAQPCEPLVAGYRFIDFDAFCEGQVISASTLVHSDNNIHFSTFNSLGQSHPLVIFNSAVPTGNDPDLISPGANCNLNNCPSPNGWHDQETGNTLGMILIMETSGTQTTTCSGQTAEEDPNDWAIPSGATGTIRIDFDEPHNIGSLGFLDDIDIDIRAYRDGSQVFSTSATSSNDNEYQVLYLQNLMNIDRLELDFNGSGALTHLEVCEVAGIMPLELTSFQATTTETEVVLNWETQSEMASEYFEVQKSNDGATFSTLSMVDARGSEAVGFNYQLMDFVPGFKGTLFYRIIQHNFDGSIDISEIRSVSFNLDAELHIFPNPVTDIVNIVSSVNHETINIFNLQGQLVRQVENGEANVSLSMSDLDPGMYIFEISGHDKTIRRRIHKM